MKYFITKVLYIPYYSSWNHYTFLEVQSPGSDISLFLLLRFIAILIRLLLRFIELLCRFIELLLRYIEVIIAIYRIIIAI